MSINIKGIAPQLLVYDMPASVKFYQDIIGFEIAQTSEEGDDYEWVLLELNGTRLMLHMAYESSDRPSMPDPDRVAYHTDTSIFLLCEDIDGTYDTLLSKGITLRPPKLTYYGMKQLYMKDPDGYQVCFQWPVEKS